MTDPLRILLINAINPDVEVESRYPHLGLAYLAATVRAALPDERIEFRIIEEDVEAVAREFRPHLCGISSVSQNFGLACRYEAALSAQGIPVIFGGIHISVLPQTLPRTATAACLGESEMTFVDVVKAVLHRSLAADRSGIPGLAYWEDGRLHQTADRPVQKPLDKIPFPARDLLRIRPHTYMFTSRGCPYRCSFCASSRYWDNVRFFSAQYVADEIQLLVRQSGVTMISFFDDLFAVNRPRLKELIQLLDRSGLLGKVQFTMNCRANLVDAELAGLLAQLGVVSVGMGLESGDEETLRYLKGGNVSVEHNRVAIENLKKAGIAVNASFVIGSPGETREQMQRTYDFIRHSRLDLFDVYLLTPYPGTPVWQYAKDKGMVSEGAFDWTRLDVNAHRSLEKAIVLSEEMGREEVLANYRRFRRLRLWRNLSRVWNHPLRGMLPRMALMSLLDNAKRLIRRNP